MTNLQAKVYAQYALAALVGALLATGLLLGNVLSGTGAIEWRPLAAVFVSTFFGTLATTVGASFLPKNGHAEIAALADSAGHAAATTALADTVAAQIAGVASTPFTAEQVQQIVAALHAPVADDLEQRMKAAP
jgi:hypothetical protein